MSIFGGPSAHSLILSLWDARVPRDLQLTPCTCRKGGKSMIIVAALMSEQRIKNHPGLGRHSVSV